MSYEAATPLTLAPYPTPNLLNPAPTPTPTPTPSPSPSPNPNPNPNQAAARAGDMPNAANIELMTTLETLGVIFAILFLFEMLLKMAAVGLPNYLSNGFNVLDAVIVFFSIFELIATIAGLQAG
jgi:hypothetical protein